MRSTLVLLSLLVPGVLAAQVAPAPIDVAHVDSAVTRAMRQQRVPGASIALVRGGRIELLRAYGSASLDPRVPADTTTLFSIGSVTKEFVSALALLLQEDGLLSVHDTVARWYPNLTRAREVTLLDLMNHVSGYHDYYPLDFVDREMARPTTADHIIREYATRPLDFDPGTRWSYSNTGYAILGRVLERVAKKPLGALLRERIFEPLGMRRTVFEPGDRVPRAAGYISWALGEPRHVPPEAPGWLGAAGGIWSTPADLARWDLALMRPGFLSPASRALLFGERSLRDGTPTGYAAGLTVQQPGGRTVYQHGGATEGFIASNAFVPADTAAVIVLVNGDQGIAAALPLWLVSPVRSISTAAPQRPVGSASTPPTPAGSPAGEVAADFFRELQHGKIARSALGDDYAAFLTPARVAAAARTLGPLGEIGKSELLRRSERGGMEVSVTRLTLPTRVVSVLMYRSPQGKIEEYLLW